MRYRTRMLLILGLLAAGFAFAGTLAFAFDSLGLMRGGRATELNGREAHIAGVVCFFVAAYWLAHALREHRFSGTLEYRYGHLLRASPYFLAAAVSLILLTAKYG